GRSRAGCFRTCRVIRVTSCASPRRRKLRHTSINSVFRGKRRFGGEPWSDRARSESERRSSIVYTAEGAAGAENKAECFEMPEGYWPRGTLLHVLPDTC